jgi:hypothetical protein
MDIIDFEELMAEILNITDEERGDESFILQRFYDSYGIEFNAGFELAKILLRHTIPIEVGVSKKVWHTFVSRKNPVMLMKIEAD